MESIKVKVPFHLIEKASLRTSQITLAEADDEFRQLLIIATLSIPVEFGHFIMKRNNSNGKRVKWDLHHSKSSCKRNVSVFGMDGELSIDISGSCSCGFIEKCIKAVTIKKLKFVRKLQEPANWIPLELLENDSVGETNMNDSANVYCCFSVSDDDKDVKISKQKIHVGRQVRLDVGSEGDGETLLEIIRNFFIRFVYNGPITIETETRTIPYKRR